MSSPGKMIILLAAICSIVLVCPANALIHPESLASLDIGQLFHTREVLSRLPLTNQCEQFWLEVFVQSQAYQNVELKEHYKQTMILDDFVTIMKWLEARKEFDLAKYVSKCWNKLTNKNKNPEEHHILEMNPKTVSTLPNVLAMAKQLAWPNQCAHFWYGITKSYYSSQLIFERGSPVNIEKMKFFAMFLRELKNPELEKIADYLLECTKVNWSSVDLSSNHAAGHGYVVTRAIEYAPSSRPSSPARSVIESTIAYPATGYDNRMYVSDNRHTQHYETPGEWGNLVEHSLLGKIDWIFFAEIVRSISKENKGIGHGCLTFWDHYLRHIHREHLLPNGRAHELDMIDTHLLTQVFQWLVGVPQTKPVRELASFVGSCIAHVQDDRLLRVQHELRGKVSLTEGIAHDILSRLDVHKLPLSEVEHLIRKQSKMAGMIHELGRIVSELNAVVSGRTGPGPISYGH